MKACPDCGAPINRDMKPTMGCWWFGQQTEKFRREGRTEEQITDWFRQGGDPPCEGNAYTLWSKRRDRRFQLEVLLMLLIIIGVSILAWGHR